MTPSGRWQQAAGEQRVDGHAAHARWSAARCWAARSRSGAPVAASRAIRSPGLYAALDHLREQDRADGRHVGGLRAGNAGDQVHRADQHIGQPAAHVAQQVAQEAHHQPGEARSNRGANRGRRTGHGQQDQGGHALVQTVGDHREIARRRPGTGRRRWRPRNDAAIGTPRQTRSGTSRPKKISNRTRCREVLQGVLGQNRAPGHGGDDGERQQRLAERGVAEQLHQGAAAPSGRRRRAARRPGKRRHVGGRQDVHRLVPRRTAQGGAPGCRGNWPSRRARGSPGEVPPTLGQRLDDGGHAHVLAAVQGDHGAQHGQPEEEQDASSSDHISGRLKP